MPDTIVRPVVIMSTGTIYGIYGVDASKAPALAREFDSAKSAEGIIKVVQTCLDLNVPLWAKDVAYDEGQWLLANRDHVVSINCLPFD